MDSCFPMRTMRQMVDMMERQELSVRSLWDIMENKNEVKMRSDMPGLWWSVRAKRGKRSHGHFTTYTIPGCWCLKTMIRTKSSWNSKMVSYIWPSLLMPENYDTNKIKLEFENGVMHMTIPKVQVKSKIKDLPENREMEKIMVEFKNEVLNIKIPKSKVESKVKDLSVMWEGFNCTHRALVRAKMGRIAYLQFGLTNIIRVSIWKVFVLRVI